MAIAVDYRLAPEHPFPTALEESGARFSGLGENAPALGDDRSRIGVGGTTAGGNLAAATAIRSRTFDGPDAAQ